MNTKLFHYHVPSNATTQEVAAAATEAVRDSRCDILFVDQWTHEMLVRRIWELDSLWGPPVTPHYELRSILVLEKPVEVIPVVGSSFLARLEGHKRVAVLTVS